MIDEAPPYAKLLDHERASLHTFEADDRHRSALKDHRDRNTTVHDHIVGNGHIQNLHVAKRARSGMTSLLKPSENHLAFFNEFERFGEVSHVQAMQTTRLDDVEGLPQLDYLKIDTQGAELQILNSGDRVLETCVAIQLEVSFIPLYENQPTFGEIDVWMRSHGYLPHTFADLKEWSIFPTIREGDYRLAFNQLLEADIVYVRDLVACESLTDDQLKKVALIAHYCYSSVDLAVHCIRKLEHRHVLPVATAQQYLTWVETHHSVTSVPD